MTIENLKAAAASVQNLTPEGRHIPHRYGSASDKEALKKVAEGETDSAVRAVRREQLAKFIVVSPEQAAKHAATMGRKLSQANNLIDTLKLVGPGKAGVIAEGDARRYLIKTFREIRHQIAARSSIDLQALAETVAEHLGTENVTAVLAAVTAENNTFKAEHEAATKELGDFHVFHEDIGFHDARLQA